MQGKFIVFEGNDGAGKSTISKGCHSWLKDLKYSCQLTSAPGGTEVGHCLRQILLTVDMAATTEALLYIADCSELVANVLKPALEEGITVLCDRYFYSTIAYQSYGRSVPQRLLLPAIDIATQGLKPDITFWLDIDPEIGLSRKQSEVHTDRFEQEELSFHTKVRQGYYEMSLRHPEICRIDASDSQSKVLSKVQGILRSLLLPPN